MKLLFLVPALLLSFGLAKPALANPSQERFETAMIVYLRQQMDVNATVRNSVETAARDALLRLIDLEKAKRVSLYSFGGKYCDAKRRGETLEKWMSAANEAADEPMMAATLTSALVAADITICP